MELKKINWQDFAETGLKRPDILPRDWEHESFNKKNLQPSPKKLSRLKRLLVAPMADMNMLDRTVSFHWGALIKGVKAFQSRVQAAWVTRFTLGLNSPQHHLSLPAGPF